MSDKGPGLRRSRPWQGVRPGAAAARQDAADELLTLVVFDIASDKVRRKVGEVCKDYGLRRAQWSVFEGIITRNRREELWARLIRMIEGGEGGGRIAVYPIGKREAAWAARWMAGGVREDRAAGGDDD